MLVVLIGYKKIKILARSNINQITTHNRDVPKTSDLYDKSDIHII
jgi:hypothetical protein